jgi:hypothetical protein
VGQRKPDIDTLGTHAGEPLGGNADDRELARPDPELRADDLSVAGKASLPQPVTHHGDVARRDLAVLGRAEEPA